LVLPVGLASALALAGDDSVRHREVKTLFRRMLSV
jgi:hypothetical protein